MEATARPRVPAPVAVAMLAAWALALAAHAAGRVDLIDHGSLNAPGRSVWTGLAVFVLAWQVMIVAMMLPTSLPLVRMFTAASRAQPRAATASAVFLGAYATTWTAFGALAFVGDAALHRLVERVPLLESRPQLIGGAVLVMAGVFQFTPLKQACLRACRHPGAFLLRYYRRGVSEAFRLGLRHGLHCLGCCWALMVVAFALGTHSLLWTAGLTALMAYEKSGRAGHVVASVAGAAMIGGGAVMLLGAM